MKSFNRVIVLIMFLIAIAISGLVIHAQGEEINNLSSENVVLKAEIDDLREDYETMQTITANRLDEITETIDEHDRLITELERLFYSQ